MSKRALNLAAALAGAIVAVLTGVAAAVEAPPIPPVLYTDLPGQLDHEHPTWMAADEAVDAEGRLSNRFSDYFRMILQDFLVQPVPGRCIEVGTFHDAWTGPPGRGSLAGALARDPLIVRGTVAAATPGFLWAEPGQLLRLEVDQVYRAESALDVYYFFVPAGTFRAGPYEICKTDGSLTAVPQIGDEVILLGPEVVNAAEPLVRTDASAGWIVLRPDGTIVLPERFREETHASTRGELLAWLEQKAHVRAP